MWLKIYYALLFLHCKVNVIYFFTIVCVTTRKRYLIYFNCNNDCTQNENEKKEDNRKAKHLPKIQTD